MGTAFFADGIIHPFDQWEACRIICYTSVDIIKLVLQENDI